MSDERLKPCPFCGEKATIHKSKFGYGVMCKTPFCCNLTSTHDTKKEAIKTWNTRKPMERIVTDLEELRADFVGETNCGFIEQCIDIVKGGA